MVVNAFAPIRVPFQKSNDGPTTAQVCGELGASNAHHLFRDGVGIVCDHDAATIPRNPLQIGNRALHIQTAAIGPYGLANRAAPVVDAGYADREEARPTGCTMIRKAP